MESSLMKIVGLETRTVYGALGDFRGIEGKVSIFVGV